MDLLVVATLWVCWCIMHSVLINASLMEFIHGRLPKLERYHRLLYNALAFMTLLPLVKYTLEGGDTVFSWKGWGILPRVLLQAAAIALFWSGARKYDMWTFLGLHQLRDGKARLLLDDSEEFLTTGVFGLTRHPWYLGTLLYIWSVFSVYSYPVFLATVILSLYLVIGTMLEERKIVRIYGQRYRSYQQQVSMLFPWKWLKKMWRK